MCDLSTDDRCDVWNETRRRARKEHRCDSCRAAITPGRLYVVTSMVFDGYASSEKSCLRCFALAKRFGAEHRLTPSPSSLLEYLDECVENDEDGDSAKWRRAAQRVRARSTKAAA